MGGVLPSGTVTLLFSDVEASTALLGRLRGPLYAEVLEAQRRVLRAAWAEHLGTELGTEGDGFFVAFSTAGDAVAAAVQAQRGLAEYPWPQGEQVRVRIGVHTGAPISHQDGYVGMDVHRAARIAAAANGGQVVISDATSHLLSDSLPKGVELLDLGSHLLKDFPAPQRLYQLQMAGLPSEFPPLKTLGAAASLPVPATDLVGRDAELAGLAALLRTPEVRLVTLTGTGGSGKTRLAIAFAQRVVEAFPDGVYFVPLADVTSQDVMWTTIATVLDLPSEVRTPSRVLSQMAQRNALIVLDNLEQLPGADRVVSDVLASAPRVTIVATARRPLHVAGEHEYHVPGLEVPHPQELSTAERAGAVRLFVQQATMVRSGFALTDDNVADVVEVCRRLDGLPLAIELAAARAKVLSPSALVGRLDKVLEFKDAGVDRPMRQQTLRATIAWSHDLLTSTQRVFFRRLGVFAGGADMDAILAVTTPEDGTDPLDLVSGLVDANLATVTETPNGEPRVGMLVTVRAYANEQQQLAGEIDLVHKAHAQHYVSVAQRYGPVFYIWAQGQELLDGRRVLEVELDNFREALRWALGPDHPGHISTDNARLALRLSAELVRFWSWGGYLGEARAWLEQALRLASDDDTIERGKCLVGLAEVLLDQGHISDARASAATSVEMFRRLGDKVELAQALRQLGFAEVERGDMPAARRACEESHSLVMDSGDQLRLGSSLADLAFVEAAHHRFDRSLELYRGAIDTHRKVGAELAVLHDRQNMAYTLRMMGQLDDAHDELWHQIPRLAQFADPGWLIAFAEDYGAVLAELGDSKLATQLLGSADAMRDKRGTPRSPVQDAQISQAFAKARAALPPATWDLEYHRGARRPVEDALTAAYSARRQ